VCSSDLDLATEAAAAIGCEVAQIAKSLVFRARASGRPVLVIAIGGVPPLGHDTPPVTLIDRDLLALDEIWAAAGTPNAVFRLTPRDLVAATGGQVADIKQV
jgi:prolyl-tRNA editing enzyme YbaK/EbsC (Cys-tRNA(Pro) deacylase)